MYPIIILAGGASARMGQPKGLVLFSGRPWLEIQLRRLQKAGFNQIFIVLGFHADEYFRLSPWRLVQQQYVDLNILITVNPKPDLGSFSSLQFGVQNIKNEVDGVFVLPVDVPTPEPVVFQEILNHLQKQDLKKDVDVLVPTFQGKRGHPVWISNVLIKRIVQINPRLSSARLDYIIRDLPMNRIFQVEVQDSSVILNLNTPEDFFKIK